MKYLLELFLDNKLNQSLSEDFLKKQNNKQYVEIIKSNPTQYSLIELLNKLLEENRLERFKQEVENILEEKLYHSFIHGINHNERVLFFTFLLGFHYHLVETDIRIVLDAAKYHDVGRVNDSIDPSHGRRSAEKVLGIVDDPIYQNFQNRKLLQGIIELHSLNDVAANQIMEKYGIEDKNRFYILFSILKDADALDRIRITYMLDTISCLDPTYLRIPYSKQLLKVAHELNEFYMKNEEHTKGGKHEKYLY